MTEDAPRSRADTSVGDGSPGSNTSPLTTENNMEKHMEQVLIADRQTTTRLGWITTGLWFGAMALLTTGGIMGVLMGGDDSEGLRLALVTISVPALFCLLAGVVTSVLWSRRTQRLTLETLQDRLARIEDMLRK